MLREVYKILPFVTIITCLIVTIVFVSFTMVYYLIKLKNRYRNGSEEDIS